MPLKAHIANIISVSAINSLVIVSVMAASSYLKTQSFDHSLQYYLSFFFISLASYIIIYILLYLSTGYVA